MIVNRALLRDPELLAALLLATLNLISVFTHWDTEQLALINAAAAALLGLIVAVLVRSDAWVPAVTGLVKAIGALLIGFGLEWTPQSQAAAMTLIAALTAMFVRTQVTAPVPATVRPPPASRGVHERWDG